MNQEESHRHLNHIGAFEGVYTVMQSSKCDLKIPPGCDLMWFVATDYKIDIQNQCE